MVDSVNVGRDGKVRNAVIRYYTHRVKKDHPEVYMEDQQKHLAVYMHEGDLQFEEEEAEAVELRRRSVRKGPVREVWKVAKK